MLNIFKYIILPITFCASTFAAIDKQVVIMRWECVLCGRIYKGENPPKFQRCNKNINFFDIWKLKSIDKFYKVYKA